MTHVLPLDALSNTHAVEAEVKPGFESDAFNAISFSKAASILRMLRDTIGAEKVCHTIFSKQISKKFQKSF